MMSASIKLNSREMATFAAEGLLRLDGIVPESIIPGMYGLEAGQSAVGDIFNWFVNHLAPGGGWVPWGGCGGGPRTRAEGGGFRPPRAPTSAWVWSQCPEWAAGSHP